MKFFKYTIPFLFVCTSALAQSQADFPMPSDNDLNPSTLAPGQLKHLSTHFTGAVGLFHTISAQKPPPSPTSIGLSFVGNYYVKKEFPAPTFITERFNSNIAVSYTPTKWTEFFLGVGFLATNDEPPINFHITQTANINFGLKSSFEVIPNFDLGLIYWGQNQAAADGVTGSQSAFNSNFIALATYSIQQKYRIHFNLGYQINNNLRVSNASTDPRVRTIVLAYGDNVIPVALGFEYLLSWASLSLEYSLDEISGSASGFGGQPQRITLGSRFFPFPDDAFAVQLGFDLGLSSTSATNTVNEPPYSFFGGLSYLFGMHHQKFTTGQPSTFQDSAFIDQPKKTKAAPIAAAGVAASAGGQGRVSGYITNIETGDPIEGAKVYLCDSPTPILTDSSGHYRSEPMQHSSCEIRIEQPDYKTTTETIEVSGDAEQSFDFGLLHEIQEDGAFLVRVKDVDGNPTAAKISFPDQPEIQAVQTNEFGQVKIPMKPGKYTIAAAAPNMELQTKTVDLASKQGLFVDFALEPETVKAEATIRSQLLEEDSRPLGQLPPLVVGVKISKDEKRVEISEKIQFEVSKATLTSESKTTLDGLAAFLKKHTEIKKLQIGGHTDATGKADQNLKLSQDRATAVKTYLVKKGIDPKRLDAKGFGQTKPIATNDTPEGQSKNRRVEFVIKERATPSKK